MRFSSPRPASPDPPRESADNHLCGSVATHAQDRAAHKTSSAGAHTKPCSQRRGCARHRVGLAASDKNDFPRQPAPTDSFAPPC